MKLIHFPIRRILTIGVLFVIPLAVLFTKASCQFQAKSPKRKEIALFSFEHFATFSGHKSAIRTTSISSKGDLLASGGADGTIKIWNIPKRQLTTTLKGVANDVNAVTFHPDGTLLASEGNTDVELWNLEERLIKCRVPGHEGSVTSLAFSSNGKFMASGSSDRTVRLWNVAENRLESTFKGHTETVLCVEFGNSDKMLASGSTDHRIILWDVPGKRLATGMKWKSEYVNSYPLSVSFSPDGRVLSSAHYDGTVRLWSTSTSKELFTLRGHKGLVQSVAFGPDGELLFSAGGDKTVRLWNARSGTAIMKVQTDCAVNSISLNKSATLLALGHSDGRITLWQIKRIEIKQR